MRVVGIAIITALLSAGCAIQAGDPTPEETQRPNELVGVPGSEQPDLSTRPQRVNNPAIDQGHPSADSPNPSPWTNQEIGGPQPGNVNGSGSGSGGQTDNPNPSP